MKKEYLLTLKEFQGEHWQNIIKEASDEKINEIYDNQKWTEKILKEGTNICRINYFEDKTKIEILQFAKENNLKEFVYYCRKHIFNISYTGNYCFPYVLTDHALKIKEKFDDKIKIDLIRYLLGYNDIKDLEIGDKVILNKKNDFGFNSDNKGKVYEITDNSITILKYRSKSKGWKINIGEEATIRKI